MLRWTTSIGRAKARSTTSLFHSWRARGLAWNTVTTIPCVLMNVALALIFHANYGSNGDLRETNVGQKLRLAKSFEEQEVENAVFLGIFPAFALFAVSIVFTPTLHLLNSAGAAWAISGLVVIFMFLNAVFSTLLGIKYNFSVRQFGLLGKYILVINGGVSVFFIGYSYAIFVLFHSLIANPNFPAISLIGVFNIAIIGAAILLRKTLAQRMSRYFRLDGSPQS